MRFLITGGAGFIGTALTNRLVADGHQVTIIDDLSSGSRDRLSPAAKFHEGDINNIPLLWSLLKEVDCVYHLAALVSVPQSMLYPRNYNTVNVGGTVCLMQAIRDTGVRRVVLASSGAVYGQQPEAFAHENDRPLPDSPYAVSKWAAEEYVHTIGSLWGIETVALRIFNAYGPSQPLPVSHAPVIPRFLHQLLTGGSIVIFGDGQQSRDFVYIDDVVAALQMAATAQKVDQQVVNIGSGTETSITQLVQQLEAVTGKRARLVYNSQKTGGVHRLVADISRAQSRLGFRPHTDLAQGIALMLAQDPRFKR